MSDSRKASTNTPTMIVVIIAGLACGAVLAWHLTGASGPPSPKPAPPVLESQRLPWDMLHPEDAAPVAADTADATGSSDAVTPPATEDAPAPETPEEYDPVAERVKVQAGRLSEDEGSTKFVKLDEELFIRVSAKLVIMASALADHPDGRDLLVDYEAGLLHDENINPDEWYEYSKKIARDPARTKQVGEAILREAEKHTDMRINVRGVPNMSPSQVANPDNQ